MNCRLFLTALLVLLPASPVGCGEGLVDSSNDGFVERYLRYGTIGIGGPCLDDIDCIKGLQCFTPDTGGGMCSKVCNPDEADCPDGSLCFGDPEVGRPIPLCFVICVDDDACNVYDRYASCRSHMNFDPYQVCFPVSCHEDSDCPKDYTCDEQGDFCGRLK